MIATAQQVVDRYASTPCNPNTGPRILANERADLYGHGDFFLTHIGQMYVGHIPNCRMEYAEVHWDDVYGLCATSTGYIEIQDSYGNRKGTAYPSDPCLDGGWWTSQYVPIDGWVGYYYSKPVVHIGQIWNAPFDPSCFTTTFYGNLHDFYTGYSDSSHNSQNCGGPS